MVRPAAPEGPPRLLLDQGSLAIQGGERLLQACDLRLAARLPLLVGLRLCHAFFVQCLEGLEHSIKLLLHCGAVGGGLCNCLVQARCLLALVLQILILGGLLDFVLLRLRLIRRSCTLLSGRTLCQVLGDVRLTDLQEANDAGASSLGCRVGGARLAVVVAQNLQGELHSLEPLFQVHLVLDKGGVLLIPELVHLGLGGGKLREGLLQCSDLLLEFGRAGCHLVDLRD
mmetsp:Transcript_29080/g.90647  ORF Transcript_29080/g.90647 Transcript_29080/m.90647 type:complete len:228 (-) Transcript_29080:512-1195(-)